jgi:hypothetical protein
MHKTLYELLAVHEDNERDDDEIRMAEVGFDINVYMVVPNCSTLRYAVYASHSSSFPLRYARDIQGRQKQTTPRHQMLPLRLITAFDLKYPPSSRLEIASLWFWYVTRPVRLLEDS